MARFIQEPDSMHTVLYMWLGKDVLMYGVHTSTGHKAQGKYTHLYDPVCTHSSGRQYLPCSWKGCVSTESIHTKTQSKGSKHIHL